MRQNGGRRKYGAIFTTLEVGKTDLKPHLSVGSMKKTTCWLVANRESKPMEKLPVLSMPAIYISIQSRTKLKRVNAVSIGIRK